MESGKTVFDNTNLASLWGSGPVYTKIVAKRMADRGLIFRVARGYYSLNRDFNTYELANLIVQPSYVSLHSALSHHGISFQVSNVVTSVGLTNYERRIKERVFRYYFMKKTIFFNLTGVEYKNNISIACPERALLDSLYFGYLPNIDNKEKLNFTYLGKIALIYPESVQTKARRVLG